MPPAQNYPGVDQVQDSAAKAAFRFVWDRIASVVAQTFGPTQGTLLPSTLPQNLGIRDVGFIFYATDFNRRYQWTGTAWTDDPASPERYEVTKFLFDREPQPLTGWARCDGSTVNFSTAAAGVEKIATPVIPVEAGLRAWVRL